jgi:tetratricopeptide (TPR) repeat protein
LEKVSLSNNMKIYLFLAIFCLSISVFAQDEPPTKKVAKNSYPYRKAYQKFKDKDFYEAIPFFEDLLSKYKPTPQIQLDYGICLVHAGKNLLKAIPSLKSALKSNIYLANYYLAKVYYAQLQLDSSYLYIKRFEEKASKTELKNLHVNNQINTLFDAMMMINQPVKVKIKSLGNDINSDFADYAPIIKCDHSEMYFTSRRNDTKGGIVDQNNQFFEDIYVARPNNNEWTSCQNVGNPLNSKEHDATVALSADGNLILIYRTDPFTGGGDFYFSKREDAEQWGTPIKIGLHINSEHLETSACISSDQQTLYFTSNRPGGYGGLDIYQSKRRKNGVWGKPQNLGAKINTSEDEESPFLDYDNQTLYFSSKAHKPNMGGFDVFKSQIDSLGNWSKPVNMGFPINSIQDDLWFSATIDRKVGYLASNRENSFSDMNIYQIDFLNEKKPNLTVLKGEIRRSTEKNKKTEIQVFDRDLGELISKFQAVDSNYLIILDNNKEYKIIFENGSNIKTEIIERPEKQIFRILENDIEFTNE